MDRKTHKLTSSVSSINTGFTTTTNNPILLIPNHSNSNPEWLNSWVKVGTASLVGFQLWAVEQNVTDRDALLPFIIVSSGNKSDILNVERYTLKGDLSTPGSAIETQNEYIWQETKKLFKSFGARLSETEHGYVPITSLPSLSPSLSIVLIPDGDYVAHLQQLYLNINLRRLGLGGRSGLKLADASPAQQLHFRQAFRLPIPPLSVYSSSSTKLLPSIGSFADTVIDLVILVQNALSLFGLGVVKVDMEEEEGIDYQNTMEGESEWRLNEGDGLLCDTTLAGLSLFRVDIGEPFLRLSPDDSILSPPLLAALLSLVISTRGKLITCGTNAVPKDPFERRAKFLRACQSFQRANSLPLSPYLTLPSLSSLSSLHARTRHPDSTSTKSKVSRALRHRIDASISLVVDSNNANHSGSLSKSGTSNTVGGRGGVVGEEDSLESNNLEVLVGDYILSKGIGGSTVGRLWGAKKSKRSTGVSGSISRRIGVGGRGDSTEGAEDSMNPPSDSDSHQQIGFGRGVLKGVKARAGRAGRKIGDGFGFTDSINKLNAPMVVISPDPNDSFSGDGEYSTTQFSSRLSTIHDQNLELNSLSRTSTNLSATWDNVSFNNSSSAGESSTSIIGPEIALGLGFPQSSSRKSPRRIASEMVSNVAPNTLGVGTKGGDNQLKQRKRRHSFNILLDAPEPWLNLSRKRLEMEVNLRMAVWNLQQKEKNLIEMVEALEVVNTSYTQALTSLSSPYQTRLARLNALQTQSKSLLLETSNLTSLQTSTSPAPLAVLITGSSKLSYSQSLLEDKLRDVEAFRERIEFKIGKKELLGSSSIRGCSSSNESVEGGNNWWSRIFSTSQAKVKE